MKAVILRNEKYSFLDDLKQIEIVKTIDSSDKIYPNYNCTEEILIIPNTFSAKNFVTRNELIEFKDYLFEDYIGKKIIVLYGNCHMQNLANLLKQSKALSEKYYIYEILPVFEIKNTDYFENPIFSNCDVFIHQSIRKENRYGEQYASEKIIKKTKEKCKIIAVPNVYHLPMCYFPQYIEKTELKSLNGGTLFFRDNIIESSLKNKKSVKAIIELYKNSSTIYDINDIENSWISYINKIELREQEWDIKILDYIKSNKYENRMFFDPNHPTIFLINYIADNLLEILNIKNDLHNKTSFNMDTYEMPLVSTVIEYFKFDYSLDNYELRKTGLKIRNTNMNIKEYVNQYISLLWQDKDYPLFFRTKSFLKFVYYNLEIYYKKLIHKIGG